MNDDINALANYISAVNMGNSAQSAFDLTMRGASANAQKYALSLNAVTMSEGKGHTSHEVCE